MHNIADEIASRGHRHTCQVIHLCEEAAGSERAVALEMREGGRVFHSLIVHYENDIPVQIEDRFVNALVAPEYLQQDFTQQTPYAYLNQVAPLTEGEHVVWDLSAAEAPALFLRAVFASVSRRAREVLLCCSGSRPSWPTARRAAACAVSANDLRDYLLGEEHMWRSNSLAVWMRMDGGVVGRGSMHWIWGGSYGGGVNWMRRDRKSVV